MKRILGSPIDPIPMEKSTRKTMQFHFLQPGDKAPYKVTGGVVFEDNDEFGVVISGEGPFFLSETLLRSWIAQFTSVETDTAEALVGLAEPPL